MIVHTFDYESGVYTGPLELGAADIDPRSHSWIIPGNATLDPPPRCGDNLMPRRINGRWEIYECVAEIPDRLMMRCRDLVDSLEAMRCRAAR